VRAGGGGCWQAPTTLRTTAQKGCIVTCFCMHAAISRLAQKQSALPRKPKHRVSRRHTGSDGRLRAPQRGLAHGSPTRRARGQGAVGLLGPVAAAWAVRVELNGRGGVEHVHVDGRGGYLPDASVLQYRHRDDNAHVTHNAGSNQGRTQGNWPTWAGAMGAYRQ